MASVSPSSALLDQSDQSGVVADLVAFFGPNNRRYLDLYEKMRQKPAAKRGVVRSWNWSVFLLAFTWFFYRKQYVMGAITVLIPIVVSLLFGNVGAGAYIVVPMYANTWYLNNALGRIVKANDLGLLGQAREDYLHRAGGVSPVAGGIAALLYLALLALMLVGAVAKHGNAAAGS